MTNAYYYLTFIPALGHVTLFGGAALFFLGFVSIGVSADYKLKAGIIAGVVGLFLGLLIALSSNFFPDKYDLRAQMNDVEYCHIVQS